jgi:Icc-related predicted phosphoesterase
MQALVFSDIHGDWRALERLLSVEADYYFAAGDLATWSRGLDLAGPILNRRAGRMYVLPGNHESERDVAAMCSRHELTAFHGQSIEIAGCHVAGLGYSSPTPFNTPGEYSEEEIARRLAQFSALTPLVLICHCPPKPTILDEIGEGRHAGSTAVKSFIDRYQPKLVVCGHIHETEGVRAEIGSTVAVNAGKRGYLIDFDKLGL